MEHYYKYVNNAITRYGTDQAGNNGNPAYRIKPVDGISGEQSIRDVYSVQANIYYQRSDFKTIYMRTASGAPAYPASPEGGGYYPWGGGSGKFPAMLFMFGQMEGKVLPYLTGGSQVPTINFAAAPATIAGGQSSSLTWSTSNVTSCSASDGWSGTKATSGTQTITPTQTTTYTLNCTGSSGSASQSITVTVSLSPPVAPTGLSIVSQQ